MVRKAFLIMCTVSFVDLETMTCDCVPLTEAPDLLGVKLMPVDEDDDPLRALESEFVRAVEFDGRHDSFVNRPRENEAPVVIGMFPDQVDTPRRGEQDSPGAVNLLELFADFFFHGLFWF